MVAEIEEMLSDANATSKGDFVCKAVEFYIGYLRQQKNINFLAPMLAGAIKSEVAFPWQAFPDRQYLYH